MICFEISELAHHGPEDLFISILKIIGSVVVMMTIDVRVTLILLGLTIFIVGFTAFYNLKMRAVFTKNREKIAQVNARIQDSLAGIRVVKSFSNEDMELSKFDADNHEFVKTREDSYTLMGRFFSGNSFPSGILYIAVLVAGGIFVTRGTVATEMV